MKTYDALAALQRELFRSRKAFSRNFNRPLPRTYTVHTYKDKIQRGIRHNYLATITMIRQAALELKAACAQDIAV